MKSIAISILIITISMNVNAKDSYDHKLELVGTMYYMMGFQDGLVFSKMNHDNNIQKNLLSAYFYVVNPRILTAHLEDGEYDEKVLEVWGMRIAMYNLAYIRVMTDEGGK